jgi:hypothetical protein
MNLEAMFKFRLYVAGGAQRGLMTPPLLKVAPTTRRRMVGALSPHGVAGLGLGRSQRVGNSLGLLSTTDAVGKSRRIVKGVFSVVAAIAEPSSLLGPRWSKSSK